jgi:uncharacterized protein (TIGR03000 family)
MRRLLLLAALAAGVLGGSAGTARAEGEHDWGPIRIADIHARLGPKTTSVTWPSVVPPGWYSNTYRHRWYYPWYAYYNFSQGPYANWMAGGGYASYAYHGPAGIYYSHKPPTEPYIGTWYTVDPPSPPPFPGPHTMPPVGPPVMIPPKKVEDKKDVKPKDKAGTVSVTLPADAKLSFNGVAASGTGVARKFQTPPLEPGQSYQYELTAEVVRAGRTERATGTVIVRAGETATVALTPVPVVALK